MDLVEQTKARWEALRAMTPEARAAFLQAEKDEKEAQRKLDRKRKRVLREVAESVRYLDGGKAYGEMFLRGFYPHESKHVPEGRRLTRERIDAAIAFLQTVEEGLVSE